MFSRCERVCLRDPNDGRFWQYDTGGLKPRAPDPGTYQSHSQRHHAWSTKKHTIPRGGRRPLNDDAIKRDVPGPGYYRLENYDDEIVREIKRFKVKKKPFEAGLVPDTWRVDLDDTGGASSANIWNTLASTGLSATTATALLSGGDPPGSDTHTPPPAVIVRSPPEPTVEETYGDSLPLLSSRAIGVAALGAQRARRRSSRATRQAYEACLTLSNARRKRRAEAAAAAHISVAAAPTPTPIPRDADDARDAGMMTPTPPTRGSGTRGANGGGASPSRQGLGTPRPIGHLDLRGPTFPVAKTLDRYTRIKISATPSSTDRGRSVDRAASSVSSASSVGPVSGGDGDDTTSSALRSGLVRARGAMMP